MAPLVSLLALLVLSSSVLASPHLARNVYDHAHRAVAIPARDIPVDSIPLSKRKRSLNKRCIPPPSNATSSIPTSPTPVVNVAPMPSAHSSSTPTPTPTPTPSSSSPAAPAHSSSSSAVPAYSPSSSSPAAPAQTPSSSSNSGEPSYMIGTQSGQGTYYSTGLGACGITNTDSQYIAAVSQDLFDSYPGYGGGDPNTNPVCGKTINASYQGKSVTVTVTDRCEACALTDLDFSPSAFNTLADASLGRISISWTWQ